MSGILHATVILQLIIFAKTLDVNYNSVDKKAGILCQPCEKTRIVEGSNGELITKIEKTNCAPLPVDCEPIRVKCGCCDVCASKLGEKCGAWRPRCENGLLCVDKEGLVKPGADWYHFDFEGICKQPID